MILKLFLTFFFCSISYGLSPDGLHNHQDYVNLSFEKPEFDAACLIYNEDEKIAQSGVLIDKDIIVTAAHGIEAIFKNLPHFVEKGILKINLKNTSVYFIDKFGVQTFKADYVYIDSRYFLGFGQREGKHDFAYIKLKEKIHHIKPAQFFDKAQIPKNALMTVVTYGESDLPFKFIFKPTRRAFRLYERDVFFSYSFDLDVLSPLSSLQESSLYFSPIENVSKPHITSSEEHIRTYEAIQNWLKDEKKPYALALPGTSGAPVFIRLRENGETKEYLFGLVTSFSSLRGSFQTKDGHLEKDYILNNKNIAMGNYQTIFSLFYKLNQQAKATENSRFYEFDPHITHFLKN